MFLFATNSHITSIKMLLSFIKNIFAACLCLCVAVPAFADCFDTHAARHGVPADLLRAIALTESSGNPKALGRNSSTQDIGLMQINSFWLSRWNLTREELLSNVCLNIEIGAWILRENFNRFGNPWEAVGAYNASCSSLSGDACLKARQRYAWKVYFNLTHLDDRKRKLLKEALT